MLSVASSARRLQRAVYTPLRCEHDRRARIELGIDLAPRARGLDTGQRFTGPRG